MNNELLEALMEKVEGKFGIFLKRILSASAEHGIYGMQMVDSYHSELPATSCAHCGKCCNSISIFSLEYHLIVREMMSHFNPPQLKEMIHQALRFDLRMAEVGKENRLRCAFRDEKTKRCLIHPVRSFACRLFGMPTPEGVRECEKVRENEGQKPIHPSRIIRLQASVMEQSETFEVFPGRTAIGYFPFEFWLYRFALGEKSALQIYREILVPASTPLTAFWSSPETSEISE